MMRVRSAENFLLFPTCQFSTLAVSSVSMSTTPNTPPDITAVLQEHVCVGGGPCRDCMALAEIDWLRTENEYLKSIVDDLGVRSALERYKAVVRLLMKETSND
jgi:hypothetical protein